MWRFSAFVLFFVLIASAGNNDALRKAFLQKATVQAVQGQDVIPLTISLALGPDGASSAARAVASGAANLSSAYTLEDRPFAPGASDGQEAVAEQVRGSNGGRPGREGSPATDTFETREAAAHIPLAVQEAEHENIGATSDPQIAAQVQSELIRLGCYDGAADNVWGSGSSRALRKVGRLADLRLRSSQPTSQTLMALRNISGALCGSRRGEAEAGQKAAQPAKRQDRLPGQISSDAVGLRANGQADGNGAGQGANPEAPNSKSYLPPWMQNSEMANVEAEAPPAERPVRAETSRRTHVVGAKRSSPPRAARASSRSQGGWRVRQRHRTEPTSHSWSFFFN